MITFYFKDKTNDSIVSIEGNDIKDIPSFFREESIYEPLDSSAYELQQAKDLKKHEAKAYRNKQFGELLQVRSNPDYYLAPSPTENIFLAGSSMSDSSTKEWRAIDSEGNKLYELDKDGNRLAPLFLELTKSELSSVSNHYEERKTQAYKQYDLKKFQIYEVLTTIEEVKAFDVTKVY